MRARKKPKKTLEQLQKLVNHLRKGNIPDPVKNILQEITQSSHITPSGVRKLSLASGIKCEKTRVALRSLATIKRRFGTKVAESTIKGIM